MARKALPLNSESFLTDKDRKIILENTFRTKTSATHDMRRHPLLSGWTDEKIHLWGISVRLPDNQFLRLNNALLCSKIYES